MLIPSHTYPYFPLFPWHLLLVVTQRAPQTTYPKLVLSSGLNLMNFFHHSLSQVMAPPPFTSRNLGAISMLFSSCSPHPILEICFIALEVTHFSPFVEPKSPSAPARTTTIASQLASPIDSISLSTLSHTPTNSIWRNLLKMQVCLMTPIVPGCLVWAVSGPYFLSSYTWHGPLPVLPYSAILLLISLSLTTGPLFMMFLLPGTFFD